VTGFALGVLASVAAAGLVSLVVGGRRVWFRSSLWRIARRRRRTVRPLLASHLGLPGQNRGSLLSRRRRDLLTDSFRVRLGTQYPGSNGAEETPSANSLLRHIARHRGRVYLINAESGFGKTALGMTLSLLRPYEGLTPLYVDLADADSEDPLAEIEVILDRLHSKREGQHFGRPLFVIDALNETVDPFRLCERLALRNSELENLGAKLLFLFSFRHRSYPGRVRRALVDHDLGPIEQMELLFDPESDSDLAFFPETLPAGGGSPASREQLLSELRVYCGRFSPSALSREDLSAYLSWRTSQATPNPRRAPSPASLRFEAVTRKHLTPGPALDRTCDIAFDLLSKEVTASSFTEITARHEVAEAEVRQWVEQSGLTGLVRCDERYIRFENETTVRVLSALSVARRLRAGRSPRELRGRTSYDVCAPYLQSAALWTAETGEGDVDSALEPIMTAISEALHGRDAPYSFYATALCSERHSAFGARREELDVRLFEQMIIAIDEDRCQTCRESLEAAGRNGREPILDPVLDQLFEVMAAYSRRAVTLLIETMLDSPVLVKSQAAYLLLDWVGNVRLPLGEQDQRALESIAVGLPSTDGNLHFRFHEVEILEALLTRFPGMKEGNAAGLEKAEEIAAGPTDRAAVPGAKKVYDTCQQLVSLRAEALLRSAPNEPLTSKMEELLLRSIKRIESDPRFQEIGNGEDAEARLECWEVTLGLAVWMCPRAHRTVELTSFIEAALGHPFWIVRWWAFAGLLSVAKTAGRTEHRVLAERCAHRAADQLCGSVEPMGLKYRQCALTKRMLEDHSIEVSRPARRAVLGAFDQHLSRGKRHTFTDGYYESMGTSPDVYLSEFFRRMAEIVPTATG
jgi:hypothetical protein